MLYGVASRSGRAGGGMALLCCLAVALAALLLALLAARPAHASTFTVTTTADLADVSVGDGFCDGNPGLATTCTLRAAMQEANDTAEADNISFAISGDGPHTIRPLSVLPRIDHPLTIDGYTQGDSTPVTTDDAVENTSAQGPINAVLKIELNGEDAGSGTGIHGLTINAPNVVIRGLVINNFEDDGIALFQAANSGNRIEGNFIGTNPAGNDDPGNGFAGIGAAFSSNGRIGGTTPAARNLVSGNKFHGVNITSGSTGYRVQGNLIGTAADGVTPLRNTFQGVGIGGSNNLIGGTKAGAGNVIAFNGARGVLVVDSTSNAGNSILGNSIHSNGNIGIDLKGDGVTANDKKDPDAGPNTLQNFPVLTSATTSFSTGRTTIQGKLNGTPGKKFTVQLFSSGSADPSGFGEGERFLGQVTVETDSRGRASFSLTRVLPAAHNFVSATATRKSTGDTSEFSEAVAKS